MSFSCSSTSPAEGTHVVSIAGDLDLHTVTELHREIDRVVASEADVLVVDLGRVTFVDSAGLGALVGAQRRVRERGGTLRIVRPRPLVARAFELTGLDRALDLRDDLADALSG